MERRIYLCVILCISEIKIGIEVCESEVAMHVYLLISHEQYLF